MDPRSWFSSLTGYFVYILSVATLGPLLFGFHLVRSNGISYRRIANTHAV